MNNTFNSDAKSVEFKLMDGSNSKIKRQTLNPFQKNKTERPLKDEAVEKPVALVTSGTPDTSNAVSTNHEVIKVGVFIAAAVSAFVIYRIL